MTENSNLEDYTLPTDEELKTKRQEEKTKEREELKKTVSFEEYYTLEKAKKIYHIRGTRALTQKEALEFYNKYYPNHKEECKEDYDSNDSYLGVYDREDYDEQLNEVTHFSKEIEKSNNSFRQNKPRNTYALEQTITHLLDTVKSQATRSNLDRKTWLIKDLKEIAHEMDIFFEEYSQYPKEDNRYTTMEILKKTDNS